MFNKEVVHTGLFTRDGEEVKRLVKRVNAFNLRNIGKPVKLDIVPFEKGDKDVPYPHYKLKLLYHNEEVKRAFWAN